MHENGKIATRLQARVVISIRQHPYIFDTINGTG